jgi:ADP-ribosylglycohydrolase
MMLGKPLEGTWPAVQIKDYLQRANAYPLRDYTPLLTPFPAGFARPEWSRWHDTTRGNISRVVQDDDVEYTLAAALILTRYGFDFTAAHGAEFWLQNFAYERLFTAERAAYRNLVNRLPLTAVATTRNPFREWIGAQIRADVYGYVCPGQPRRAAALAYQDASLSHTGNGIYGAMWVAAMIAAAFALDKPEAIVGAGLAEIPPRSRLAEALRDVLAWSKLDGAWETTFERIAVRYGRFYRVDEDDNWVHTIPNACLVALGLLHGRGDFSTSVGTAVMGGWDTDCNGATVGSVLGVMLGASRLPRHWLHRRKFYPWLSSILDYRAGR